MSGSAACAPSRCCIARAFASSRTCAAASRPGRATWIRPCRGTDREPARKATRMAETPSIDPRVDIGHVHLKVADLDRALGFYCGVLGFDLVQRMGGAAAFVSAGGDHHPHGAQTPGGPGRAPPPPRDPR